MAVVSFKRDQRISEKHRLQLRAFVSDPNGELEKLAHDLGLRIDAEDLPEDVSAVLVKSPSCGSPSGYRIAVNGWHSRERQRFSIAHEIGHFVLHRDDPEFVPATEDTVFGEVVSFFDDPANSYRGGLYVDLGVQRLEREADCFAGTILMPPKRVREVASSVGPHVGTMAAIFEVSVRAMQIRLRELDIAIAA